MTESDIAAIRDALAADGLTHGEWVACGPSFGDPMPRYLNGVVRLDDADGCDLVALAPTGGEYGADMTYIAACNPERIARLLDALESAQKDAELWRWFRANFTTSPATAGLHACQTPERLEAHISAAIKDAPYEPHDRIN